MPLESTHPVTQPEAVKVDANDPARDTPTMQRIWDYNAENPLRSLWDCHGTSFWTIVKRTVHAFNEDDLISRAAELGYYFFFALFPALIATSALLGMFVRSGTANATLLLNYLSIVIPHSAMTLVLSTFSKTVAGSSGGKVTFGILVALWSASVGFAAIQDILNVVYKTKETRPYWKSRGEAMLVTILLGVIALIILGLLLGGTFAAHMAHMFLVPRIAGAAAIAARVISVIAALAVLMLLFAVTDYYAPNLPSKCWRWITPGATVAIVCWVLASLALRVYLYYFDSYSSTYGSLGAVIILLTWFYITGLALLLGSEFNSEIEVSVAEKRLKEQGKIPLSATADPDAEIE